jgi:hypothetical protein
MLSSDVTNYWSDGTTAIGKRSTNCCHSFMRSYVALLEAIESVSVRITAYRPPRWSTRSTFDW